MNQDIEQQDEEAKKKESQQGIEIKNLAHMIIEAHKQIDAAYDERLRRLEAKKKLLPDEKTEEQLKITIGKLKERLNQLKSMISDARKHGKDTFMPELVLKNVNAKIQLAETTGEQKDFEEVEKILTKAEEELKQAMSEEEVNVKKELELKLKQSLVKETGRTTEY